MSETMTVQQVADLAGVSRQTVYNWIRAGKVFNEAETGRTRITRTSVEAHLSSKPAAVADDEGTSEASSDIEGVAGL